MKETAHLALHPFGQISTFFQPMSLANLGDLDADTPNGLFLLVREGSTVVSPVVANPSLEPSALFDRLAPTLSTRPRLFVLNKPTGVSPAAGDALE